MHCQSQRDEVNTAQAFMVPANQVKNLAKGVFFTAGFDEFTGYFPCARMSNNQFTESSF